MIESPFSKQINFKKVIWLKNQFNTSTGNRKIFKHWDDNSEWWSFGNHWHNVYLNYKAQTISRRWYLSLVHLSSKSWPEKPKQCREGWNLRCQYAPACTPLFLSHSIQLSNMHVSSSTVLQCQSFTRRRQGSPVLWVIKISSI